jgi:hypothetical protein
VREGILDELLLSPLLFSLVIARCEEGAILRMFGTSDNATVGLAVIVRKVNEQVCSQDLVLRSARNYSYQLFFFAFVSVIIFLITHVLQLQVLLHKFGGGTFGTRSWAFIGGNMTQHDDSKVFRLFILRIFHFLLLNVRICPIFSS